MEDLLVEPTWPGVVDVHLRPVQILWILELWNRDPASEKIPREKVQDLVGSKSLSLQELLEETLGIEEEALADFLSEALEVPRVSLETLPLGPPPLGLTLLQESGLSLVTQVEEDSLSLGMVLPFDSTVRRFLERSQGRRAEVSVLPSSHLRPALLARAEPQSAALFPAPPEGFGVLALLSRWLPAKRRKLAAPSRDQSVSNPITRLARLFLIQAISSREETLKLEVQAGGFRLVAPRVDAPEKILAEFPKREIWIGLLEWLDEFLGERREAWFETPAWPYTKAKIQGELDRGVLSESLTLTLSYLPNPRGLPRASASRGSLERLPRVLESCLSEIFEELDSTQMEKFEAAETTSAREEAPLLEVLVREAYLGEEVLADALARTRGKPRVRELSPKACPILPRPLAEDARAVVLQEGEDEILLASALPFDFTTEDWLAFSTGKRVRVEVAMLSQVRAWIETLDESP